MRIASSMMYQTAVMSMNQQQSLESTLQTQLSSGLRIQTAKDDPVGASQILSMDQALADNANWQANATALSNRLGLEDTALSNVTTALNSIQAMALQANSGSVSDSQRQALAQQMQAQLTNIISQANAQDSNGNYLFGGTQSSAMPFRQTAGGITYDGNSNVSMLTVGSNRAIQANDAGDAVFQNLSSGNGTFTVGASSTNTGDGVITDASVADSSQWTGGTYTVSFNGGNYQVADGNGAVVSSGAYTDGDTIRFAGVSLSFAGTPADGDSYTVAPSTSQSLFSSIQNLINVVGTTGLSTAGAAQNSTALLNALQSMQGAQNHIINITAGVGARQQAASGATDQLQALQTQITNALSGVQDVDYAAATTNLSQSKTILQAAESSYAAIQGLSLFNYLKF